MKHRPAKAIRTPLETSQTHSASTPARRVTLQIESIAYGGAGVGRYDGKVYFVPFTVPGERVTVEVVREQKRFCEARLISLETSSSDRIEPRCRHFGVCGGCTYQHVPYNVQLRWKSEQVSELLQRVGRIADPPVRPTVSSPEQWAYRNRIRVHSDGNRVGFYEKNAHEVVDVEACPLASAAVNDALAVLRNAHPRAGEYPLSARSDVRFFEQTNDGASTELLRLVDELIGENGGALVDAYSGAGFFGRRLASRFEQVIGIEVHPGAVEAARRRAGANERYLCGDVALLLGDVLAELPRSRTVVLLDPPAAGVAPRVLDLLTALPVAKVVYVSCDPATLARDLGGLSRGGYGLKSVTPLDMFPHTADVEVVAELGYANGFADLP